MLRAPAVSSFLPTAAGVVVVEPVLRRGQPGHRARISTCSADLPARLHLRVSRPRPSHGLTGTPPARRRVHDDDACAAAPSQRRHVGERPRRAPVTRGGRESRAHAVTRDASPSGPDPLTPLNKSASDLTKSAPPFARRLVRLPFPRGGERKRGRRRRFCFHEVRPWLPLI